jgi:hypothetical protein
VTTESAREVASEDRVLDGESPSDGGEQLPHEDDVLLLEEEDLVLPVWEPTGEPGVDAALDRLVELDPEDVHQHAAVFDDVHRSLRATLTDLEPSP